MRGLVSFHAVDLGFFDGLIGRLVAGQKVNPEQFLTDAKRIRNTVWQIEPYRRALRLLLQSLEPPPPPQEGTLWTRVRAKLEQVDFKPDATATLVAAKVDADLHLDGRPFLITEGSSDRVAIMVEEYRKADSRGAVEALLLEQLIRIDPSLPAQLELPDIELPSADASYRAELLESLRAVHDLPLAARNGDSWGPATARRVPAIQALPRELPGRVVDLHARIRPGWFARDVDGLVTVCRSAEVEPPDCLVPARRIFAQGLDSLPSLGERMSNELAGPRDIGAFCAPGDMSSLNAFLGAEGAKIIRAATRHGAGTECATLLRKIRECAEYAERNELGYLEASGVLPLAAPPESDEGD